MTKRISKREAAIRADEELLLDRIVCRAGREPTDEERSASRRLAEDMNRLLTAEEKASKRRIAGRIRSIAHLLTLSPYKP